MSKKIAWAIGDNVITVRYDNQTHHVGRQEELADDLIKALRENRVDDIPDLINDAMRIVRFGQGDFAVQDGRVMVDGQPVHDGLSRKILQFQKEKLPHQPLVEFARNLQKNPSYRAVNELFQFLEKNDHPITPDGNFIAYKRVREDFTDIHTGTFNNSVGTTVEMNRNQVNEDSTQTCSHGLHVANWNYAHTQFASHNPSTDVMLEVEVNPADVVSIPVDYNQSKMRVCKYTVIGVVDHEHSSDTRIRHTKSSYPSYEAPEEEEYEEEEEEDNSCQNCGDYTEPGYDLCYDCEDDEDEDDYPWEDEVR